MNEILLLTATTGITPKTFSLRPILPTLPVDTTVKTTSSFVSRPEFGCTAARVCLYQGRVCLYQGRVRLYRGPSSFVSRPEFVCTAASEPQYPHNRHNRPTRHYLHPICQRRRRIGACPGAAPLLINIEILIPSVLTIRLPCAVVHQSLSHQRLELQGSYRMIRWSCAGRRHGSTSRARASGLVPGETDQTSRSGTWPARTGPSPRRDRFTT